MILHNRMCQFASMCFRFRARGCCFLIVATCWLCVWCSTCWDSTGIAGCMRVRRHASTSSERNAHSRHACHVRYVLCLMQCYRVSGFMWRPNQGAGVGWDMWFPRYVIRTDRTYTTQAVLNSLINLINCMAANQLYAIQIINCKSSTNASNNYSLGTLTSKSSFLHDP